MKIHNGSASLTPEALAAFATLPRRQVLSPGEHLYRFGTIVNPTFKGNEVLSSPWWIPATTYRQITKTAHRTRTPVIEVARAGLAVTTGWNPNMDWLTIFELKVAAYAWIGPARPQPLVGSDRSVLLLGHLDQAYVPNLAPAGGMASAAGTIIYCGCPF
jgi:hypothetical protein